MKYLKTIGIVNNGDNGRGFTNPCDIAHAKDGRIYVINRCDYARRTAIRVGILNFEEEYIGEFSNGYGDGDGQFFKPVAIAIDSGDRLFVTDEFNKRVSVFDSRGKFLYKWGSEGVNKGDLRSPSGIAVDGSDNVYVADQYSNKVTKFSDTGEYIESWGSEGTGDGQFNMPWGLAVDVPGNVYVADWRNDRIQKFSPEGDFITRFGSSGESDGEFNRPSSVDVDSRGNIYVADWGNNRVQIFDEHGDLIQVLKGDATLSKWAEDFFAANPDEKELRDISQLVPDLPSHLDTPDHVSSQTEPFFWGPVSVGLDYQSRLHVVETNRHRIQIYGGA